MKRKSIVLIIALFVLFICVVPVNGATGTVRVKLPSEMNGTAIYYQDGASRKSALVQEGVAVMENLSPGDYKIHIPNTKQYEFQEVEVRVPTWSEEEQRMLYDISLEPKYQRLFVAPKTGDYTPILFYGIGCAMALAVGGGCMVFQCKKRNK